MKPIIALILCLVSISTYNQVWDCEVIRYELNCDVTKNTLNREFKVLLQINNRAGEKYTRISISFSGKNKISDLYAHIEDVNGNVVRKLKNSDIKERSAISEMSLYEDDFIKWFELKHNVYPYRIYYSYRSSYDDFLHIAKWSPALHQELPTHMGQLNVKIPEGYEVNVFEQNISAAITKKADGDMTYTWNKNYEKPLKREIFSPPFEELIPLVKVAAKNFRYGIKGSAETWKTYGDWQYNLNFGLDILPETEQMKVRSLIDGISDKKEITRRLYHYMQDNTRYISVQIDIGGLKTYPAAYVAVNKFGDCKALSNYMKSLLNVATILSYYTLIYADENPVKPISDFPENQFNHVVLFIPLDQDSIWLECTNKDIPYGYFGTSTQNRPALIIDKGNSHFITTPGLGIDDNVNIRKAVFDNIQYTSSNAEIVYNLNGGYFEMFNDLITSVNKTAQEEEIRKFIPFSSFELTDWKLEKKHRDSASIALQLQLKITNHGRLYGNDIMFTAMPFGFPKFETPAKRTMPVKINYPYTVKDEVSFKPPKYSNTTISANDTVLSNQFGYYSFRHQYKDNLIRIVKQFALYAGEYPLEKYAEFYKFISDVEKLENNTMIIIPK